MDIKNRKIVAISVVKDEADIIALSVLNMLMLGVDAVIVLDNSSTDETLPILNMLSKYDNRVVTLADPSEFDQKSLMGKCLALANSMHADWVIPFDADEFWAIDPKVKLRDYILEVDLQGFSMISVVPNQYIVSGDAIETFDFSYFGKNFWIQHRMNNSQLERNFKKYLNGKCSFLEIKQPEKLIFKAEDLISISAGQHGANYRNRKRVLKLDDNGALQLFHLPFRSYANLKGKADQGRRLIEAGMPKEQGWQHRFWASMDSEELRMEWNSLHIGASGNDSGVHNPNLRIWDDRLHYKLYRLGLENSIVEELS